MCRLSDVKYEFNASIYEKRVDYNVGKPQPEHELKIGPNIKPWPEMAQMPENLMLVACKRNI